MPSIKIDQLTFPVEKIQAKLHIHGIYAIPQQWKAIDQANPGLFTYVVRMSKFQISKGKISPRQLTQKQRREQEQKNKKGGKKDSKNPQPNQEEERIKRLQEQRQKQRQQLLSKLTQQEQFHHTSQDIYRSPYLKFQQNSLESTFKGNDCLIFQERLLKDRGDWVYVYKITTASEEELAKMRKTKPKTLGNINDLNPITMRAWVSFQQLSNSAQLKQIKQLRCKVSQVDKTADTPEPNLQRTYMKITFSLIESVIKEQDQYSFPSLIDDLQKPKQIMPQIECLEELKQELSLGIQSLAIQYSTLFWKQINMQQQQRNSQIFLNNKKGQLTKRKQQFLYDFNVTGKYKILKDRIKKCIVHICQSKYKHVFSGTKSFNGVKCNRQDQIYSQIYDLLVKSYQQILFKIICYKQESLGQILILNNQTLKQAKQNILTSYKDQTVTQRIRRIIREYQVVQNFRYGQQVLRKHIQEYPQIAELKYQYGTYCLKYNLRPAKQVLPFIEQYLTKQKFTLPQEKKIEYMLILLNDGVETYAKGWVILRQTIQNQTRASQGNFSQSLCRWLLLASIVLKVMDRNELSAKYKSFSLREYQKSKSNVWQKDQSGSANKNHKDSPHKSEIPSISGVSDYSQIGTAQQLNKLYDQLVSYLNQFSAFQLIRKIINHKESDQKVNQNSASNQLALQRALPQLNQLLVGQNQGSRDKLLELSLKLYAVAQSSGTAQQKNKVLEFVQKAYLLRIISNQTTNLQDLRSLETYLKKTLITNKDSLARFHALLRLGYVYSQKQQFANSRACLLKYLEKSIEFPQFISGLSYKILGISCLKLQRTSQAIQNFKHWNLSDTKSRDSWFYLALAFAQQNKLILVNQCLSQYMKRIQGDQSTAQEDKILSQIKAILLSKGSKLGQYQRVLKTKILQSLA